MQGRFLSDAAGLSAGVFVGRGCSPPPDSLPRQGLMPCTLGLVRGTFSASAPGEHAPGPPDGGPPSRLCCRAAPLSVARATFFVAPLRCRGLIEQAAIVLIAGGSYGARCPSAGELHATPDPNAGRDFPHPRAFFGYFLSQRKVTQSAPNQPEGRLRPPLFFGYFLSRKKVT